MADQELLSSLSRLEERLADIDKKIDRIDSAKHKSLQWIGQLSQHVEALGEFREEVRASFEPLFGKLDGMDEIMRILRHATSDVSRRIDTLEREVKAG